MRFIISVIAFFSSCTFVFGQGINKGDGMSIVSKKFDDWNKGWTIKEATKWYSETGNGVIKIQNSLPKGGGYTDSKGKNFGYRIFFTRLINEGASPLDLMIGFPSDSSIIPSSPDSYLKLFVPQDIMTLDKEFSFDYGLDVKSFLDAGVNKSTMLEKTINAKEEYIFYIIALFYEASGNTRAELVLNEQDLFYRISPQLDSALIPCGHVVLRK